MVRKTTQPGDRYGDLLVLREHPERAPDNGLRFVVRCQCGTELVATGHTMRAGKKRSCGCRRHRPRMDCRGDSRLWDAVWLERRYVQDALSMTDIAAEIGCSTGGVRNALIRANIPIRSARKRPTHGHAVGGSSPTYISWVSMIGRCYNENRTNYRHYGGRGVEVCQRWRESFAAFLADMGERPDGKSIDRIDPDGNYEPANCRWATQAEQIRNRRPRDKKV